MKVAHINTHTYGGAAIVAKRIHQSLLNIHVDSLLVTKFGIAGNIPKHIFFKNERLRNLVLKYKSAPTFVPFAEFIMKFLQNPHLKGRPNGFEIFSPLSTGSITPKYDVLESRDIIHLHWINDFFGLESFIRKFSHKKFIWTLHDMNPITGGCHHSDGCLKFETTCICCPQLQNTIDEDYSKVIQDAKIRSLKLLKDDQMIIASPSLWLLELSQKSQITKRFRHVVIPNPAFENSTVSSKKDTIKEALKLPHGKKIVMFASANLNNPRKGVNLLFNAVRLMPRRSDVILIGIGHRTKHQDGLEIIYTGSISNVEHLANYFTAADIFVTPTLAENSPLVVIESLCCGTPVVASDVGGIPDLINSNNGILFSAGHIQMLADAMTIALFEKKYDYDAIRNEALAKHNPTKIAEDYLDVYRSLLRI